MNGGVSHGSVFALVPFVCRVLAPGPAGSDPLSHRMASATALPVGWDRGARRARIDNRRHSVSRALVERAVQAPARSLARFPLPELLECPSLNLRSSPLRLDWPGERHYRAISAGREISKWHASWMVRLFGALASTEVRLIGAA